MKHLSRCSAALFALGLLALSTGPAPAIIRPLDGGGGNLNLSGMYSGSVTDSVLGTGTAVANLAHSGGNGQGDPFGGWMSFTFGSTTYSNPTSASRPGQGEGDVRFMDGGGNNALHGVFVSIIGSAACTFHFTATFNPSSFQLNGQYSARIGCSGENGTFSLTQQCFYQLLGHVRRNTGSGPGPCT